MTEINKLIELGTAAALNKVPSEFSLEEVNATLREELKEFNNYSYYREHKNSLFALIEGIANVVVPRKVIESFGAFAEVQSVKVGDKLIFKQRTGVSRGKGFITKAAEYGTYRTFTLDSKTITMSPRVYAGAAILELGDFLTGRVEMAELMDIILSGLSDSIYSEVQSALQASITASNRPAANKVTNAGFDTAQFDALVSTVAAYGDSVTVYCTRAFASTMYNAPSWNSTGVAAGAQATSAQDYEDVRNRGYVGTYKGANVVLIEQSFTDENNTDKVVDDQYAYVMPAGKEKPVKIGIEGGTLIDEMRLSDGSMEIQAQHMFDIAVIANNYWGIYKNTSL